MDRLGRFRRRTRTAVLAVVLCACSHGGVPEPSAAPGVSRPTRIPLAGFESVDGGTVDDPAIEALIATYRVRMDAELSRVLGMAEGDFRKDDPEGALDNLVADALLDEVREAGEDVDAVLLNDGGLRIPLPAGPLRVSHGYELLPFENYVTILTLTGRQMEALADEIARTGGEPVSGWTMVIRGDDATEVQIGGEPIDSEAQYKLATVDYLADGGGSWTVLWEPVARQDLSLLIRDVFMEYVREEGSVRPNLDGRVRMAPPGGQDRFEGAGSPGLSPRGSGGAW